MYFLENGNILLFHLSQLPDNSTEYDFTFEGEKFAYKYYIYETGKKKAKPVELDIYISFVLPRTEDFPIGWSNMIRYKKIDKDTKELQDKELMGGLSNDLSTLVPFEFDFGEPENLIPLDDGLFAAEMEYF